jgi:hypothetical protein
MEGGITCNLPHIRQSRPQRTSASVVECDALRALQDKDMLILPGHKGDVALAMTTKIM